MAHFVTDKPNGLAKIHNFVGDWSPLKDSEDSFERAFGLRYEPLEARVREDIIQYGGNLRLNDLNERTSTDRRLRADRHRDCREQAAAFAHTWKYLRPDL